MAPAVGQRVFLRDDGAEQPCGLQGEDEDDEFEFHGMSFGLGSAQITL
jgi:hypothetical protein